MSEKAADTVADTPANPKPLHFRVAEALGCKVRPIHLPHPTYPNKLIGPVAAWECGCPAAIHASEEDDYGCRVADYDTDWSTTGPLVEKLSISLDCRFGAGMPIAERWQAVAWRPDDNPKTVWKADGSTPLVNVCRLIVSLSAAGKLSR